MSHNYQILTRLDVAVVEELNTFSVKPTQKGQKERNFYQSSDLQEMKSIRMQDTGQSKNSLF